MRTCFVRLGLSLMVMVSVWTHGLPAQEKIGPPHGSAPVLLGVPPPNSWELFIVPTVPYEPEKYEPLPLPFASPPPPGSARHRLMQLMNQHGYGCTGNDGWGCGNACYDLHFFFGSCRDYFGERCDPCQLHNRDRNYYP